MATKVSSMATKRVSPAILPPLKEALTLAFWYKPDLRTFLTSCLSSRELVAQLDWTAYKRTIVAQLVDSLAAQQHKYFDDLLNLILATADVTDPAHLKRVDDGQRKYDQAAAALNTLRQQVEPYRRLRTEEQEADRRREADRAKAEIQQAMTQKLEQLRTVFYEIVGQEEQKRGYSLERFLNDLFGLSISTPSRRSRCSASRSTVPSPSKARSSCWRPGGALPRPIRPTSTASKARSSASWITLSVCSYP